MAKIINPQKKNSTIEGIEFGEDQGLDIMDVIKLRIAQQAMKDYIYAYKHVCRICHFPDDFNKWTASQNDIACRTFNRYVKDLKNVSDFFLSGWYSYLYEGNNGDLILDHLNDLCEKKYGKFPDSTRIESVISHIKEVGFQVWSKHKTNRLAH